MTTLTTDNCGVCAPTLEEAQAAVRYVALILCGLPAEKALGRAVAAAAGAGGRVYRQRVCRLAANALLGLTGRTEEGGG